MKHDDHDPSRSPPRASRPAARRCVLLAGCGSCSASKHAPRTIYAPDARVSADAGLADGALAAGDGRARRRRA